MKPLLVVFLVLLSASLSLAQRGVTVSAAEYFFDTDPGYGFGTPVDVAANQDVTLNFTVDLSGVSVGNHMLFMRVRDSNGRWSLSITRPIIKEAIGTTQPIVQAEYFFDSDPGPGNGTPIDIPSDTNVVTSFVVDLSAVGTGLHVLYIRVKDASGRWSLSNTRPFLKEAVGVVQNIVQAEYFVDTDPGFGNGIPITSFMPGTGIDSSFVIDLSSVSVGLHVLFIRVKNESGQWSLSHTRPFLKEAIGVTQNIVQAEYFFDTDPGFGNGTPVVPLTPAGNIDQSLIVDLSAVSVGQHVLFMRVKDAAGRWSISSTRPFFREDVSARPSLTRAEYYFDADPGFGQGAVIPLSSTDTSFQVLVGLAPVTTGLHVLYLRTQDETGEWSHSTARPFIKEAVSQPPGVTAVEYFFARDTQKTAPQKFSGFAASQNIEASFVADVSALEVDSTYDIHLAVIDSLGRRSLQYVHSFMRTLEVVQPGHIDFGHRLLGSFADSAFSIVNFGEDTLHVLSVVSTIADFAEDVDTVRILPGQAYTDTIRFLPSATGPRAGYIIVTSDSPTSPDSILVKGYGFGIPVLAGIPGILDFGVVEVGSAKDSVVFIANSGNDTLFVTTVNSVNPAFLAIPASLVVPPGGSAADTIRFDPASVGPDSGFIVLTSNSVSSPDTIVVRGTGNPSTGVENPPGLPTTYELHQNYPNPFNPSTTIRYQLPRRSRVVLRIYNLLGKVVETLVHEEQNAGYYEIQWNPTLASGVYFYRLQAEEFVQSRKLLLLK